MRVALSRFGGRTQRRLSCLGRVSLGLLAMCACSAMATSAETPPNIVLILADDLGSHDLGCYGRAEHHTPNLDRLAAQGARFTNSYAAQSVCSPTRLSIMTGKSPARSHLTTFLPGRADCDAQMLLHPDIRQQLPLEEITLAERLKGAGYTTGCFGKWHLGNAGYEPTDQGFDVYQKGSSSTTPSDVEGGKGEFGLTNGAIEFIDENREKPFFVYLAHNSPHIPYAAKSELIERNSGAFEPVYAAVIESLDETVGLLLKKLDDAKLTDNTIVVFTSDNGGLHVNEGPHERITDNSPCRAGKGFLYEGGIRTPLLIRWPGHVPAGATIDTPVISTDLPLTLLDLAGQSVPSGLDGVSFAALSRGQGELAERSLFWHLPHYTNQGSRPSGAVRQGAWKLIEHYEDGRVELCNLDNEPSERNDLAASQKERAAAMRKALEDWLNEVGAQRNTANPDFDRSSHDRLYVDIDVSKYVPREADEAEMDRIRAWRKLMNQAVAKPNKKGRRK